MINWRKAIRWVSIVAAATMAPVISGGTRSAPAEIEFQAPGELEVRAAGEPNSYHVLYSRTAPGTSWVPIAVAASGGRIVRFRVEMAAESRAGFFSVGRIPIGSPLDLDGDGLNDLYELQRAPWLSPLDAGDAGLDPDGDVATTAEEFRIGSDPLSVEEWRLSAAEAPGDPRLAPWSLSFQLGIERGGFRFNRANGRFVQTITLTNTRASALLGPVELLLGTLDPGVTLFASDGSFVLAGGSEAHYRSVRLGPGNMLQPGGSATIEVEFTHPSQAGIRFTTEAVQFLPEDSADADEDGAPDLWEAVNGLDATKRDNPHVRLSSSLLEIE